MGRPFESDSVHVIDMWEQRDFPVLRAIVELCEEHPGRQGVNRHEVRSRVVIDDAALTRSLAYLYHAEPRYIISYNGGYLYAPTERGLRTVGAWPSPEVVVTRIIAALEQIAESSASEEKKSAARRLLAALPGVGQGLLVNILSGQVPSFFN